MVADPGPTEGESVACFNMQIKNADGDEDRLPNTNKREVNQKKGSISAAELFSVSFSVD